MNGFLKRFLECIFEESILRNRTFEKLLLEAVDDGLSSLGDSARYAIYFHLKVVFKVSKRDIPYKIEKFADGIEKIFGLGAKPLEILIMQRLYEKVGGIVEYPKQKDLVFIEYVAAVKQSFLKKKKQEEVQCAHI
jgi:hypothetical protein